MFTTAIIAFREFLEAFLIIGIFLGISRKLGLKKEVEILLAALFGILTTFILSGITYLFGDQARTIMTQENADFLESYLLIFSGFFIAYVIFSLHSVIGKSKYEMMNHVKTQLQQNAFDVSLFLTIMFMVIREGFEIALFTSSTSLFTTFVQNMIGFLLGFSISAVIGTFAYVAYMHFPIGKVFRVTEYLIILVGASLVQNGITKLFATHFNISLSNMVPFHLSFLPSEDNVFGHLLQSIVGIDRGFSLARLSIMGVYIGLIYMLFLRRKEKIE